MVLLPHDQPPAIGAVDAVQQGDADRLAGLLRRHPELATAGIVPPGDGGGSGVRTLLHVLADWPGHRPRSPAIVASLVDAGADVDARFQGAHTETPLHWAASNDDVELLDALLDAGADIEAPGAVIAGGTPLDDAVAFGQWRTARRLVERGARTALWHAAALGLTDRVEAHLAGAALPGPHPWGASAVPPPDPLTVAFWCACHGGQRDTAERLLARGAPLNWASVWDGLTPLDAAERSGAHELAGWLRERGARPSGVRE